MSKFPETQHDRILEDQFTRQAKGFAGSRELHGDDVVGLVAEGGAPGPGDRAIDIACGTGSVACALAARAAFVVGLDATEAMLDQARALAARRGLSNIEWRLGGAYATGLASGAFDVVTCRFAFHHLEDPARAFAEMVRLARPGGRIVLCDGAASDDPARAAAFNAMERLRDPSTTRFATFDGLRAHFIEAGLGAPAVRRFHVTYNAAKLVEGSFPEGGDRAGLLRLIEDSVDGDRLGMNATRTPDGVEVSYPSVVLSAVVAA